MTEPDAKRDSESEIVMARDSTFCQSDEISLKSSNITYTVTYVLSQEFIIVKTFSRSSIYFFVCRC